jgi:hypothetical protein
MATRQARLERVALIAFCHESMVIGWAAASRENGWICAQQPPGSAHTEIEGPLVEIGPRSVL